MGKANAHTPWDNTLHQLELITARHEWGCEGVDVDNMTLALSLWTKDFMKRWALLRGHRALQHSCWDSVIGN